MLDRQQFQQLVREVQELHRNRGTLASGPLKRRGFKRRPTPRTEVVAEAAAAKIRAREASQRWFRSPRPGHAPDAQPETLP